MGRPAGVLCEVVTLMPLSEAIYVRGKQRQSPYDRVAILKCRRVALIRRDHKPDPKSTFCLTCTVEARNKPAPTSAPVKNVAAKAPEAASVQSDLLLEITKRLKHLADSMEAHAKMAREDRAKISALEDAITKPALGGPPPVVIGSL